MHQWPPFFGGKKAYSTARATVKAAKPHLNPFSSTSERVTARAKPPEYLQASFLKRAPMKDDKQQNSNTKLLDISIQRSSCTDLAHGSLRPLAASLCCVNSSGVPSVFHCRQSGIFILPWPWSPPMLKYDQCSHYNTALHAEGLWAVLSNCTNYSVGGFFELIVAGRVVQYVPISLKKIDSPNSK